MRIRKGDAFVCKKTLYNDYKVGKTYISEWDGCITNESGNQGHVWGSVMGQFKEYFATKEELFDTMYKRLKQ